MSLLWHFDSLVPANMFADTAKTTPITDGAGVAAVVPSAGSITTDALQSTSGSRPTYRANYSSSGYPGIEFDGSSDFLSVAHSSGLNQSILDMFVIITVTSATGSRGIITKWTTVYWNDGWGLAIDPGQFSFGSPSFSLGVAKMTLNTRMLIHCRFQANANCGQFGVFYGGSISGTGPQNNSGSIFIGRGDPSGSYWFQGAIHEIFLFGGGETDQVIVDTKQSLRSKWGLPSTTTSTAKPQHTMYQQVIG